MRLRDRVAIITGAAQGIGAAYAVGFANEGAKIVIADILEGVPCMPHYVASKGAVMALTRSMAKELGDFNINVNTIAPGFTHSEGGDHFDRNKAVPIPPLEDLQLLHRCIKRAAVPEDLVGTALFLATDDSAFISGQMIVHDGGLSFYQSSVPRSQRSQTIGGPQSQVMTEHWKLPGIPTLLE